MAAYELMIADGVQDQHLASLDLTITDNASNTWSTPISFVLQAPKLMIGDFELLDASGNGILEPGETATINVESYNTGSSDCGSTDAVLSTSSMYINITSANYSFTSLPQGGTIQQASFTIEADPSIPYGTAISFDYDLTYGMYNAQETFDVLANMASEDYETGNLLQYDWSISGNAPWLIVNSGQYEGDYCAKSGPIGSNQSTIMELEVDVAVAGDFSFFKKVSSEDGYDYLQFYIDNILRDEWTGIVDWSQESYWLTTGSHTLKWEYVKDGWVDENDDCSWVDYILFPQLSASTELAELENFDLKLVPNPAQNQCQILFSKTTTYKVNLYDTQGKLMLDTEATGQTISLDLSTLASGIYFIEVTSSDKTQIKKLIIQ
jgi:hypothetical protein